MSGPQPSTGRSLRHVDRGVPVLHALRRGALARRPLRERVELAGDRALRSHDHERERRARPRRRPRTRARAALWPRSSGMSSRPVSTSPPTAAAKPPRLLVSTRHTRPPRSTTPASALSQIDRSLIATITPIGQEAGDEAGEVVRVAERRPHRARRPERSAGVDEVDPVPVRAELDVGGLDEPVEDDQPSAREHERREDATEVARAPATRPRPERRPRTMRARAVRRRTGTRRRCSGWG